VFTHGADRAFLAAAIMLALTVALVASMRSSGGRPGVTARREAQAEAEAAAA
jgi:hypothetical protein